MTLEEIQGAILEKVNSLSDPFTGCIAHVFDASALKYYIVASDNVVALYELDRNILSFNDSSNNVNELSDLMNTKFSELTSRVDSVNSELGNRINEVNSTLTTNINTKANQDTTYTKTETDTKLGLKADKSATYTKTETYTKAEVNNLLNAKANQNTTYNKNEVDTRVNSRATWEHSYPRVETYTKTEVNNLLNAKANSNAVVALSGNQTVAGVKTFSSPPVSATNPTANNQVANKAYVDSVGNTAVKLTGNQTIAGTKTFSSPVVVPNATANTHAVNLAQLNTKANANATVNLTGNQTIAGVKTFSALPVCNILPTVDNQVANRNYVKKRGGFVTINSGSIDLNRGMNFSLNITRATNITVANAASNIGQTGEIYVSNGANIRGFNAPFNFRVAQGGFGANEVFSYLVVSANLVRITRS